MEKARSSLGYDTFGLSLTRNHPFIYYIMITFKNLMFILKNLSKKDWLSCFWRTTKTFFQLFRNVSMHWCHKVNKTQFKTHFISVIWCTSEWNRIFNENDDRNIKLETKLSPAWRGRTEKVRTVYNVSLLQQSLLHTAHFEQSY